MPIESVSSCQNRTASSLVKHQRHRVGEFKWDKKLAYTLGRRTEGVVTGRVRLLSSRSRQAVCWPRFAEISLQGFTSAFALVLCIHTGVSELLAHDKCGVFFPLRKGILCVQKMGRSDRGQGQSRNRLLRITNDCRLES